MRLRLIVVLFLIFVASSFGQEPVAVSTQSSSPEKTKIKNFGSSLKNNEKKNQEKDSQTATKNDAPDDETIRIKTDLVVADVLVVNQKADAVLGLGQSDFVVTEDGVPQNIEIFSFGEKATIPLSIVLIIDYSSSQFPYIKNSIEAAKKLVDKLASQDKMAIVTDDVKVLAGFTKDKTLLKKELDELGKRPFKRKFGRSQQYTALVATLNEMFDEEDTRPIVIFQTDGDELPSLKGAEKNTPPGYNGRAFGSRQKSYGYEDVCALVNKSRAIVYSIIPGFRLVGLSQKEQLAKTEIMLSEVNKSLSAIWGGRWKSAKYSEKELIFQSNEFLKTQSALFEMTKLSGGYTDYIEKPEDAENVYSNIFAVINNRYVIGYYPLNEEKDGKRRNVKIEVKGHPEYTVTGRKAYITPVEEK